jgi:hypothetical protein
MFKTPAPAPEPVAKPAARPVARAPIPNKKSNTTMWILIGAGVVGALLVVLYLALSS